MMLIRKAIDADIPQLEQLFLISRRKAFTWEPVDSFKKEDYIKSVAGEDVLVAETECKIIGFISIYIPDNFIHNLFVHPDWQQKGAGTLLLEAAKSCMFGDNMKLKLLVMNTAAGVFYAKSGWVVKSTHIDPAVGAYYLMEFKK